MLHLGIIPLRGNRVDLSISPAVLDPVRALLVAWMLASVLAFSGCVTIRPVRTYWVIHVDGDVGVAMAALKQASIESGGKPVGDGTGPASFSFGRGSVSYFSDHDTISVSAFYVTYRSSAEATAENIIAGLVSEIVLRANRESTVPLQLERWTVDKPYLFGSSPGVEATNPKMKAYGGYLQRVFKVVQLRWDELLAAGKEYPPTGSWVRITFVLAPDGHVSRIEKVESHTTSVGERAALTALTNENYGEWTAPMKSTLDPSGEPLVFTFYYE